MKKLLHWMIGLSVLGIVLSTYAFLHNRGFSSGALCNINDTLNCDVVNKGPFSQFFGIPVAFIGMVGYFFLLIGSLLKLKTQDDKSLTLFLLALSSCGFGFSLYLTSIEAMVLFAWCLICVTSQIVMFVFIVLVIVLAHHENHFHPVVCWFKKLFRKS